MECGDSSMISSARRPTSGPAVLAFHQRFQRPRQPGEIFDGDFLGAFCRFNRRRVEQGVGVDRAAFHMQALQRLTQHLAPLAEGRARDARQGFHAAIRGLFARDQFDDA